MINDFLSLFVSLRVAFYAKVFEYWCFTLCILYALFHVAFYAKVFEYTGILYCVFYMRHFMLRCMQKFLSTGFYIALARFLLLLRGVACHCLQGGPKK